jgi:3-deoxy-D-manno-octulosonate 8-phosphate phosphatase (KDO 8-P phosphatase)
MPQINEKAKRIKLLLLDVDGVLTNGQIILGNNNEEYKAFHVHDGEGISFLQKAGINVGLVTKRQSEIVHRRAEELRIQFVYQNQKNKLDALTDILSKLNLDASEVAYMGDDLPDLPILSRVGLSTTVSNAPRIMRDNVMWVSQFAGGAGAVRELCELIMNAQNKEFLH